MAQKGCFTLTDSSGYTEFLTGSELDHALDGLCPGEHPAPGRGIYRRDNFAIKKVERN